MFIGRAHEMATLRAELDLARAGHPRVVVVEGDAGVGKSSLLAQFLTELADTRVMQASGEESEILLAYGVLAQLLGEAAPGAGLSSSDGAPPGALAAGAELVRLLDTAQGDDEHPLVLLVDDLHWADQESAAALLFAIRRLRGDRVLALFSTRRGELGRLGEGWERFTGGDHRVTRILLSGFGRDDLLALSREMGVPELSAGVARSLLEHTEGNPLYCRALLEELTPEDLRRARDQGLAAPRALATVIVLQLSRLPTEACELIVAASVLGVRSNLTAAVELAGLSDPGPPLDAALSSGLLSRRPGLQGPELVFHPLVRRAIYDDLLAARRHRLHLRAAELLSGAEALDHRVAAAAGADTALAAELDAAARAASELGRSRVAAQRYSQAAALSATSSDRERRLLDVFEHLLPDDVAAASDLEADMRRLPASARLSVLLGHLERQRGEGAVAEQSLLRGWNEHDPSTQPLVGATAAGQLSYCFYVAGRFEEVLTWTERAIDSAGDDAAIRGVGVALRASSLSALGRAPEALAGLAFLPDNAGEVPLELTNALIPRGFVRIAVDQPVAARQDLLVAATRLRAGVRLYFESEIFTFLGEAEFLAGIWDDAALHTQLGVSLATDVDRVWDYPLVHAYAALVPACRGEWALAEHHVSEAIAAGEVLGLALAYANSNAAAVVLAAAKGDHAAALDAVRKIRATESRDGIAPGVFDWRPLEIEALIYTGQLARAAERLTRFESALPQQHRTGQVAAARLRGTRAAVDGDRAAAAEAFARAWHLAEYLHSPFELGLLGLADGERLRRAGERREATQRLHAAREQFARLGARPYMARCEQALSALGAAGGLGSGSGDPTAGYGLTPAELAVARLVASGKRNREVAEELYVTVKTVEFHLRGIFTKLGITSRRELTTRFSATP